MPSKAGAFLIEFYGGIGTSWSQAQQGIAQREQYIGRKFDGIHVHFGGDGTYKGIANCIAPDRVADRPTQWINDRGQLPLVTWSPGRSLADINAGLVDSCIANVADYWKSFDFVVMLRLFHEFDGSSLSYHGCGRPFTDAWKRVVGIFQQRGATNVGFWWTPNEGVDRACVNSSYPGDQFVDWVGSDSYNWCYASEANCWSTPQHAGWGEFSEIFDYPANTVPGETSQHDLWGPRKPFVIGETGAVFDPNAPLRKGDWFRGIPAAAKNMQYLRGISVYDQDVSSAEGPKANFRVDNAAAYPSVYAGFKQMANDPWFNTR